MKISYSFGIVDLLHYGHINTLLQAGQGADHHVFGLVSDEASLEWTGALVSNYDERKRVIECLSCVDEVVFQKTLDPLDNIQALHEQHPEAVITLYHGNNWKILPSQRYLESIGGNVVFTQYYEKLTPENIVKSLNQRRSPERTPENLLSTKANTLFALKQRLALSKIEDIFILTAEEYERDPASACGRIYEYFGGKTIVVRSSCSNEDTLNYSNAGHYDSVLNVDSSSLESVSEAVRRVLASYRRDGNDCRGNEQILIQSQTTDAYVSGVIFTRDIQRNRPYYLVNYDDNGSTDSVTSGKGGKSLWLSRDTALDATTGTQWHALVKAVHEIESIFDQMILDIEFAINRSGEITIFQVRPLAANYKYLQEKGSDDVFSELRNSAKAQFRALTNGIDRTRIMLSDMAFWNPSEIVGSNPPNLDYSLYREIITKRAWNEGLVPMGYKELCKDLMYRIGNKPYISLDYSFYSLIPDAIDDGLTRKLMRHYRKKLLADLTAHDKIEFEIVLNCFDFETDKKLEELRAYGFTEDEVRTIRTALFNLTHAALTSYFSVLERDASDIAAMSESRKALEEKLPFLENDIPAMLHSFKTLIADIKTHGTPQFARQARYAFIARALCRSMVSANYFSEEDMDMFMLSIRTVASEFEEDLADYLAGALPPEEFNKKYGHLRSGTYDIQARRYDQIHFQGRPGGTSSTRAHRPTDSQLDPARLKKALDDADFRIAPEHFLRVLKSSFEQREYFKFEFTKSLSLALEILVTVGRTLGIDRGLLSYLEMPDLLAAEYYVGEHTLKDFIYSITTQRKSQHAKYSALVLPDVLVNETDIDFIRIDERRPNFITKKRTEGELVLLEDGQDAEITDKIVLIPRADPGFDWIFARGIKGLITKYGGVASHMAIRCAEFGIPAAIGCGEKIYTTLRDFSSVVLDCKKGRITRI